MYGDKEHTILLSRKRVNKEMKRTNSLVRVNIVALTRT